MPESLEQFPPSSLLDRFSYPLDLNLIVTTL